MHCTSTTAGIIEYCKDKVRFAKCFTIKCTAWKIMSHQAFFTTLLKFREYYEKFSFKNLRSQVLGDFVVSHAFYSTAYALINFIAAYQHAT